VKRRRLFKLGLLVLALLLLGAIVNVAVAWGYWIPRMWVSSRLIRGDEKLDPQVTLELWRQYALPHWVMPPTHGHRVSNALFRVEHVERYFQPLGRTNPTFLSVSHFKYGWPCRSMHAFTYSENLKRTEKYAIMLVIEQGDIYHERKALIALMPLWPGFAINTIFYAATLWVLFFAPGTIRRIIRRKRGLCPACAYPVGTSDVCTECGAPVTGRRINCA
jgi:hypothetical protein